MENCILQRNRSGKKTGVIKSKYRRRRVGERQIPETVMDCKIWKRTPVKDEFMRCLMEMKYLAEGTTVDLGGKRRKQGAKIAATLGLSESLLQEKVYKEILLQELQNVFLKFIEVSRGGRAFTSLVFGMGQMSEEGVTKKIAQQISMIAFRAPHQLHMEKEFALLQEAALEAFRQVYPNREHFLKK